MPPNSIFPGVSSPQQIYSSLTNLFGSGSTSPDTYAVASGKSIMDIVWEDLANLQRVNMSGSDQKKLSDWADLLNQTSRTVVSGMCNATTATSIGLRPARPCRRRPRDISKVSGIIYDLALLTAVCDANRTIFMKMPPNYVFSFLSYTARPTPSSPTASPTASATPTWAASASTAS